MSNISSVSELDALYGLPAAKRTIRGLLSQGSQTHAILLFGEEGSGKSTLAMFCAAWWLCTSPSDQGPCGECRACRSFANRRSSDFLLVSPQGLSNLIRQGAITPTERPDPDDPPILSIQEFQRTMPLQSRFKVVLIEDADRMNSSAANTFLKTLEEPPDYLRFVLTTTQMSRITPTVRSRCMSVPCELPTIGEWAALSGEEEPWAMNLSRRSPGVLRKIKAGGEVYQDLYRFAEDLVHARQEGALALSERFRKIVERLQKAEETNPRGAGAIALQTLGAALAHHPQFASAIQRIAVSHRRIAGNVNAGLEFDALFAAILADNDSAKVGA